MNVLNPVITNNYLYDLPVFRAHDPSRTKPNGQPYDVYPAITNKPLTVIKKGARNASTNIRLDWPAEHLLIVVPGIGDMVFINLHDHQLEGYDKAIQGEFGVLLRYQSQEIYFRYNGNDVVLNPWNPIFELDKLGTLHLKKMLIGGTREKVVRVKIPEFQMS